MAGGGGGGGGGKINEPQCIALGFCVLWMLVDDANLKNTHEIKHRAAFASFGRVAFQIQMCFDGVVSAKIAIQFFFVCLLVLLQ